MTGGDAPILAVLGGGQLGRMVAIAAAELGVRTRVLDPSPCACAGHVAELVVGPYDDAAAIAALTAGAAAVTYEFERVPAGAARLAATSAPLRPGPESLAETQDRAREKRLFEACGFAVAPWRAVDSAAQLADACEELGGPAVLKTREGGYDGRGQARLDAPADAQRAWEAIGGAPAIVESLVAFRRELSLVCARGVDGQTRFYPLVENTHRRGILFITRAPAADVDDEVEADARRHAVTLLERLGHVGVLTIEFFEVAEHAADGGRATRLVANEFAPRVHNSGHWTIEGAETSQFAQHVRAVLGWPLGSPGIIDNDGSYATSGAWAMVNLVGSMPDRRALLGMPGLRLHDYGKSPRPGRKLGHATIAGRDRAAIEDRLNEVARLAEPGFGL